MLELFRQVAESQKELADAQKDTDRRFKDTDQKFKETDQKLNKLESLFTSQWGKLMESLVEGDLVEMLN